LKKLNKLTVIGRGGFGKVLFYFLFSGMESLNKKNKKNICNEINVKS
jgi:hypothetical protein